MRASSIEFEEIRLPLYDENWATEIRKYNPAARVPVIVDDGIHVWDSMAIIEHLREKSRGSLGWPVHPVARALARSVSAEMHSGFLRVREELPLNLRARVNRTVSTRCQDELARIFEMWADCRARFGATGPWLFGEMTVADVVYAPVALRFRTYGVQVPGRAGEFLAAVEADPTVRAWVDRAHRETETLPAVDELPPRARE